MAKGAGALIFGRFAVAVMGWVGTVVLVRALSPVVWGEYSLIFSIMGLVGLLADLQLGRKVIRDLLDAGDCIEGILGAFVCLRLAVGIASYGVALGVVFVGHYPLTVLVAMSLAASVLVAAAAGAALYVYFTSQMWMRALAIASMAGQAAQLVLTVCLVVGGYRSLVLFMVPALLCELVSLAWQLRSVRSTVRIRLYVDWSRWWEWLKESAPLALGTTLSAVYMRIDTIMLSKLSGFSAVGVYAIGAKFANLTDSVAAAVASAVIVAMTKSWPQEPGAFVASFRRAFLLLLVIGMAVTLEFGAFAGPVIRSLYGRSYAVGAEAAMGLVVAEVLSFFSELCAVTLIAMRRNVAFVVAASLGLVVNVAMNLVFIPRWSYNGASLATIVTEGIVLAVLALVVRRRSPSGEWLPWRPIGKVFIAGAAMAAVAFPLRGHVPWELAAACAGCTYLAVLHVIRVDGPGGLRDLLR